LVARDQPAEQREASLVLEGGHQLIERKAEALVPEVFEPGPPSRARQQGVGIEPHERQAEPTERGAGAVQRADTERPRGAHGTPSGSTGQAMSPGSLSGRTERQKMSPSTWPSVSSQFGTPGSRCATA